jgi:hypothetical protein
MATCGHCNTFILFGGKSAYGQRFCSEKCLKAASINTAAQQLAAEVPEELILRQVIHVHRGNCPKCGGAGPIDVHVSHRIVSLIRVSWWKSRPQMCCRTCGIKAKCGDTLFSLLFGWWGFPFGILGTPVQIGRNIFGIFSNPDSSRPSPALEQMVREDILRRAAAIHAMVQAEDGDGGR